MYEKVISKAGAVWRNFVSGMLVVARRMVPRFLDRANRRILFEFLVLIGLLSSFGIIAASLWSTTTISSHGTLRVDGVGVYSDSNCNVATTYLDWGTLEPGSSSNITVYIRNEGNHVATLFMEAGNWGPANATNYMSLSWNYDGRMLGSMETTETTLTLSVSPSVENIADFSFDVIIGTNG